MRQALGAGRKMDFQFYKKMAMSKVKEMRSNILQMTEDALSSNLGSRKSTAKPAANTT